MLGLAELSAGVNAGTTPASGLVIHRLGERIERFLVVGCARFGRQIHERSEYTASLVGVTTIRSSWVARRVWPRELAGPLKLALDSSSQRAPVHIPRRGAQPSLQRPTCRLHNLTPPSICVVTGG
jgi:hypothetical protein